MAENVMEVRNLVKKFPVEAGLIAQFFGNRRHVHAVDGVSFDLEKQEVFGIAGESGCGKTTTARCLARLEDPTSGSIIYNDKDITNVKGKELNKLRREIQFVFQDPYSSINDRYTVKRWVGEPLKIHGIGTREERENRIIETLEQSGLSPPRDFLEQYPHELSGGQRQRVALARALVLEPSVIIADEPTSMLDVSVRAGILRVINELVEETGVSVVYISHDISLLRYICDRIGIMYRGQIAEKGPVRSVLYQPKHPYTQALLSAVPRVDTTTDRERVRVPPEVQENIDGVQGCPFKDRCGYRFDKCDEDIELKDVGEDIEQEVACHLYNDEVDRQLPTQE